MKKLKQRIIVGFIIASIICFGLGFFLGSNNAKSESSIKKQKDNNTFEAGWNAAKKKFDTGNRTFEAGWNAAKKRLIKRGF